MVPSDTNQTQFYTYTAVLFTAVAAFINTYLQHWEESDADE